MSNKPANPLTAIVKKEENGVQKVDIEQFKSLVKASMPEFVAEVENKEDLANAMYASTQEMWLAIGDVLIRHHGWKEDELKKFQKHLKEMLTGMAEFERHGLNILSPHSAEIVGDVIQEQGIGGLLANIAETRYRKEKLDRIGMDYPVMIEGAQPFLKKLKQKNKDK